MTPPYKSNERELIKVANFFKRESKKLIAAGKLGEEHHKVEEAVDHFVRQMEAHAVYRSQLLEQREELRRLVKDSAVCPKCNTSDKLRHAGVETNDKGWKSNRYRCRKCNIAFTWNRPNNPWDMIQYIHEFITQLKAKAAASPLDPGGQAQFDQSIASMESHLQQLEPVIREHDEKYHALQERETEMEKLIHELKNSLMIERIKMNTWENKASRRGE